MLCESIKIPIPIPPPLPSSNKSESPIFGLPTPSLSDIMKQSLIKRNSLPNLKNLRPIPIIKLEVPMLYSMQTLEVENPLICQAEFEDLNNVESKKCIENGASKLSLDEKREFDDLDRSFDLDCDYSYELINEFDEDLALSDEKKPLLIESSIDEEILYNSYNSVDSLDYSKNALNYIFKSEPHRTKDHDSRLVALYKKWVINEPKILPKLSLNLAWNYSLIQHAYKNHISELNEIPDFWYNAHYKKDIRKMINIAFVNTYEQWANTSSKYFGHYNKKEKSD
jgi:hypothetical protein